MINVRYYSEFEVFKVIIKVERNFIGNLLFKWFYKIVFLFLFLKWFRLDWGYEFSIGSKEYVCYILFEKIYDLVNSGNLWFDILNYYGSLLLFFIVLDY